MTDREIDPATYRARAALPCEAGGPFDGLGVVLEATGEHRLAARVLRFRPDGTIQAASRPIYFDALRAGMAHVARGEYDMHDWYECEQDDD